eukprot:COSAG02_NODE_30152_length_556_cov_1.006565_1_plen_33_part_10
MDLVVGWGVVLAAELVVVLARFGFWAGSWGVVA